MGGWGALGAELGWQLGGGAAAGAWGRGCGGCMGAGLRWEHGDGAVVGAWGRGLGGSRGLGHGEVCIIIQNYNSYNNYISIGRRRSIGEVVY